LRRWYLPAAQRRLWQNPAGLPVLYESIETLCRLLAPFLPFLADLLYQKLAALPGGPRLESVHLAEWPTFDPQRLEEARLEEMHIVRSLAEIGQAARAQTAFAAYQPLAEMMFWVPDAAQAEVVLRHAGLLAVVLNVQRIGAQARQTAPADLPGEGDEGIPPGLVVYARGEYAAALHTASSPELTQAGLAGAFSLRVQALRQEAGLGMGHAVRLHVQASPRLAEALAAQRETLLGSALATELFFDLSQAAGLETARFEYGAERATLALEALRED
jgi:valyl-tRNA synthetase